MTDKYYLLVSFLINILPEILRDLILQLAKTDSLKRKIAFSNLKSYLHHQKSNVNILKRPVIRSMIFENTDLTQLDVSSLFDFISIFFESQLGQEEKYSLRNIRDVRNKLMHIPGSHQITDEMFNELRDMLQKETLILARNIPGKQYEEKIRVHFDDSKEDKLQETPETLRGWFKETVTQLKDEIKGLEWINEMDNMRNDISCVKYKTDDELTDTILPGTSSSDTEQIIKKMKTIDQEFHRMKGEFKKTMDSFSTCSGILHPDVLAIQHIMTKHHHVVVTGTDKSRVLETACNALNHMKYDITRCVEICKLGDWHCFDLDDVDLVVFRDPFDREFDGAKGKGLLDLFTNVLHATNDKLLDFMITCDANNLAKFKEEYKHRLLTEVVVISQSDVQQLPSDDKTSPLENVIVEEDQRVIDDIELPNEQEAFDSDRRVGDLKSTLPNMTILEYVKSVAKAKVSQMESNDGLLPQDHILSDDDLHKGDRKSPWQNVETVEGARALISDGMLPLEHELSDLVLRLGRKSEIVQLVCQNICRKIASMSPNFVHVFAAYTEEDEYKLHFVVLSENKSSSDLKSEYQILFRYCKGDKQPEPKHYKTESEGELSVQESIALKNVINAISKQYMENHRYLSAITASKIASEQGKKLSIVMYVHLCTDSYSSIPLKEEPLPKEIQGFDVIVRNGVFKTATKTANEYHDNLRMGCGITSNLVNSFGTLGGFIDHHEYGLCGFTCAHVVYGTEQMKLLKRKKRYKWSPTGDSSKGDLVPCFVYQPTTASAPVGRVVEAVYTEGGDSELAGVDLALFQIEIRPPVTGTFPRCSSNYNLKYASGTTWGRSRLKPERCEIQKFGVVTGITHGKVKFDGMTVRELQFVAKGFIESVDAILYNQYEIDNDTLNVCEQGDSGGLVFMTDCTDELKCIGMVNGVLDTVNPLHGVVTPITDILRELNVQCLKPFKEEVTLDMLEKKLSQNEKAIQVQQQQANAELRSQIQGDMMSLQPYINERVSDVGRVMMTDIMNSMQPYMEATLKKYMDGIQRTIKNEIKSAMLQNQTAEQTNELKDCGSMG